MGVLGNTEASETADITEGRPPAGGAIGSVGLCLSEGQGGMFPGVLGAREAFARLGP